MVHLIPRRGGDEIFKFEEKLIDEEMVNKIKLSIEEKLNDILGVKTEVATTLNDFKESYITSEAAKRYHTNKCAFANNIPENKRIIFSKEEALESGKKPCSCVTGKKIPLKEKEKKIEDVEVGLEEVEQKLKKKSEKKVEENNNGKEDNQDNEQEDKKEDVSLDDIADLFK